jgi:hypothetical protein
MLGTMYDEQTEKLLQVKQPFVVSQFDVAKSWRLCVRWVFRAGDFTPRRKAAKKNRKVDTLPDLSRILPQLCDLSLSQ